MTTKQRYVHRMQCAAITNGCTGSLAWANATAAQTLSDADEQMLRLNGWHLDHGRWVCGAHPS